MHLEDVHVNQIRFIDRGTPCGRRSKSNTHRGSPREQASHDIQALIRLNVCFIPGDRAGQGLMGVDNQHR